MNAAFGSLLLALGAALVLTPAARVVARRLGMVALPRADRWHATVTPKAGGFAIFLSVNAAVFAAGLAPQMATILIASALMFLVGLFDDLRPLAPAPKIILQLIPSLIIVKYGLLLPWTEIPMIQIAFTLLWLVGITNAINLLDNMDGLAAGIAAIAALSLATTFIRNGQTSAAIVVTAMFMALLGFLVYNFNPASIFMGDNGSLFVGFFLASTALLAGDQGGRSRTFLPVLFVPVMILLIPIFDTMFVAFVRKIAGRSSMEGGKDHTSHRLVALGLSERTAVLLLYSLALAAGAVAIAARDLSFDSSLALIGAVTLGVTILGFYLAGVKVYPADEDLGDEGHGLPRFLIDLSYRRRIFEVLLDVVLITYAYYLAFRLHFGPVDDGADWQRFTATLPVVIGVKVGVFLVSGLYSAFWRYLSAHDGFVIVRAVAASTAATVLVLLGLSRFEGLSRVAFLLDGLILFLLVIITRGSFRVFGALTNRLRASGSQGVRTLLYGAGDGGELLARELRNNQLLFRKVVVFFDDDAKKSGKKIHSIPVVGGDFRKSCLDYDIGDVVLTTSGIDSSRLDVIKEICRELNLPLHQMRITLAPLSALSLPENVQGPAGAGDLITNPDPR